MTCKILFTSKSKKQFNKLPKQVQIKIANYLERKVQLNPLSFGKCLSGNKKGLWRYRVEDYRIICQLNKEDIVVLILDVGHRRDVYN